ncbi:MAG: leucine-rich repeat protein [Bacilli bacterium]|nr:leucine-rich repeat protein [Bacilli bacterium]
MTGEFLANRRTQLGLSQGKVAEALGYSTQTISLWEKGKGAPGMPVWGKLASLYQLDLEGLLLGEERKGNENCESKEFDPASFGPFLRSLRKKEGLTQAELAKRIGVPTNAIIRFEQGSSFPDLEQFKALSNLFGLSYDEFYFCAPPVRPSIASVEDPSSTLVGKPKKPGWLMPLIIFLSVTISASTAIGIAAGLSNRREKDGTPPIADSSLSFVSEPHEESVESKPILSSSSPLSTQSEPLSPESSGPIIESLESSEESSMEVISEVYSSEESSVSESSAEESSIEESSSEESSIEESSSEESSEEPSTPSPTLYQIDFDLDGGTSDSYKGPVQAETLDSCLFFDVNKPGYDFKGWQIGGEWIMDENGDYLSEYTLSTDVVLVAKYEAISYPIHYVLDDGENNENNPSSITVNDTVILQNPCKNGFILVSWYSDKEKETPISSISGSDLIEAGSITIYAKFEYNALDPYNYPYLEFTKLSGNRARVKGVSSNAITGTLKIPSKISLGGDECLVTEIADNAFSSFAAITGVTFPSYIEKIGDYAFSGCSGLTAINLRPETEGTIQIGEGAFAHCENLLLVYLSDLVDSIGSNAFVGSSDELIILFQGDYDSSLFGQEWNSEHKPVVPYSIGAGVYRIGNVAYVNAGDEINQGYFATAIRNNPSSVTLESMVSGVPVMGVAHNAFYGAGSSSFALPDSMVYIGEYAFAHCASLSSIHIPINVDTILSNAFLGDGALSIYCESSYKPYGWSSSWNPSSCPIYWGV